jgi:hypothetical protein
MSAIVFFATEALETAVQFYQDRLDMDVWLEQPDCTILQSDNLLLGFWAREEAETEGTITLVSDTKAGVDRRYEALQDIARGPPTENERYEIYQFFATDPEGRTLEFQTFHHPTDPI